MTQHTITKVYATTDAVDRLEWQVNIDSTFYGTNVDSFFAYRWDGLVRFSQTPMPVHAGASPTTLTLPLRWTNMKDACRFRSPGSRTFMFASDVPERALDRIEAYRASGRLYARIEGALFLVHKGTGSGGEVNPWLLDLARVFDEHNRSVAADLRTEPLELTRDFWCGEVLGRLRPPGRVIFEATIPQGTPSEEHGARAVGYLSAAERAFDAGQWEEAAHNVYKAGEALLKLGHSVETRYGDIARAALREQCAGIQRVCNDPRHDRAVSIKLDRVLVHQCLISMKSLAAVYLASAPDVSPRLK